MTRLIIARHGNTFAPDEPPRRVGLTDLPLVPSGEAQASALAAHFQANNMLLERCYCSELQRTTRMAEIIRQEMQAPFPIIPLAQFNEIDYGVDENQPESAVIARIGEDALKAWDEKAIIPEGWRADIPALIASWQSFADMLLREANGQTILVVTSNGTARFAPHLTGDMNAFRQHYKLKLATGAYGVLMNDGTSAAWRSEGWNIRP